MYKWITSNVWPGPDLLQSVPTLVLNVDLLMIFFIRVKGPVESFYCRQRMFLSCLMIFFHTQNFYNRRGTVYYKSSLIFTHIGCVCDLVSNYLCGGVSYNMRNFFRVCVCVVCGLVCVSRNLCDLVLNYCRQRLFLSCLMIFSCSIVTNYVQMINQ